jgi:hypothetical protein
MPFAIPIIATDLLSVLENLWLRSLVKNIPIPQIENIIERIPQFSYILESQMYLDIVIQANINTLKQLETNDMNKAIQVLRENQHFNKWFIEATAEAIAKASEKARAEAFEKARAEEHAKWIETARKLKQLGLNNEVIVETTGLHLQEIKSLN